MLRLRRFPDEGSFFLGIRALEKLYANRSMPGGFARRTSRTTRSGATSGSLPVGPERLAGEYASLAHYFDSVAETLTKIAEGDHPVCEVAEGRLVWS
ncbi:hypothetical protein ACWEQJ_30960 [Streptomyces cyaneofuscatus]